MQINSLYKPLYTSKKRYFLLTGGRASLKTSTVLDFIQRLTFERGHGILLTRYTMTSAEKSIIPEFATVAKRNGTFPFFYFTKDSIKNNATGSFIRFSGIKTSSGDQTANLKGLAGITTWVVDEGEDFNDESKFDDIDNSIRSGAHQNRVIWIQNPTTKEHFIYNRWISGSGRFIDVDGHRVPVSNNNDVEHIHTTYMIAKNFLNESFLSKIENLKQTNEEKYYHKFIGGWLNAAEGVIFENWQIGEFDETLPYVHGLDFGVSDPDALVQVAVNAKEGILYLREKMYKEGNSTEQLLREIEYHLKPNDLIIADSSNPRNIEDMRENGFNVVPAYKGKDSVVNGIKNMLDYKIVVTAESSNLIKELSNYCWGNKRANVPIDKYNHAIDAVRYALEQLNAPKTFFI